MARKAKPKLPVDTDCDHGPVTNPCNTQMTVRLCQGCARDLFAGRAHVKVALDYGSPAPSNVGRAGSSDPGGHPQGEAFQGATRGPDSPDVEQRVVDRGGGR